MMLIINSGMFYEKPRRIATLWTAQKSRACLFIPRKNCYIEHIGGMDRTYSTRCKIHPLRADGLPSQSMRAQPKAIRRW